jgi:hypothetical protein
MSAIPDRILARSGLPPERPAPAGNIPRATPECGR